MQTHKNQEVHNQSNLQFYQQYKSRNNFFIRLAFLIEPGLILLKDFEPVVAEFPNELFIACYDYSDFDISKNYFRIKNIRQASLHTDKNSVYVRIEDYQDIENYVLIFRDEIATIYLDPTIGGILDTYYSAHEFDNFGVKIYEDKIRFQVWSPPASRIELMLFLPDGSILLDTDPINMQKGKHGVWSYELNASKNDVSQFDGFYYQYKIFACGECKIALDPYAFSMQVFSPFLEDPIGKAAIINMESPQSMPSNFERKYLNSKHLANGADIIAYEVNIRDFTSEPDAVHPKYAGTFIGMAQKASYLKNLGITHVQLMPVMKFYTVDEYNKNFSGKVNENINYNWGYDPLSYFSPEGWYSTNPANPYSRIVEIRELIQTLHNNNIGVIFDLVFNHTHIVETFENIAHGCYYRTDENFKISAHSGAGPSLESRRKMVQKLMLDSMKHYIEHFHADGFRFDLMSFIDHNTLEFLCSEAGKVYNPKNRSDLIINGEAWLFSDLDISQEAKGSHAAVTKLNYPSHLKHLGIFNDIARDAICGIHGTNGFIANNSESIPRLASAIAGGAKNLNPGAVPFNFEYFYDPYSLFANSVENCINYISIHDGFTLYDKIRLSMPEASKTTIHSAMKMAALILFTSKGKIILHSGDEILRSKPLSENDPEPHRAHTAESFCDEERNTHFHENSFGSADYTNMIRWSKISDNQSDAAKMLEYYKKIIRMRRSIPAFRSETVVQEKQSIRFLSNFDAKKNKLFGEFTSFYDRKLKSLTIDFINGPANETYYLAGEIHPKHKSDNPPNNSYSVRFNSNGCGNITFNRETLDTMDMNKWSKDNVLAVKLVKYEQQWNTIDYAYSPIGHNIIHPLSVDKNRHIEVNLAERDYAAIPSLSEPDNFIAYILDNDPTAPAAHGYTNLNCTYVLVVHNPTDKEFTLETEYLDNYQQWIVIADLNNAGTEALVYSEEPQQGTTTIKIEKGKVIVPARNSAVLAKTIF